MRKNFIIVLSLVAAQAFGQSHPLPEGAAKAAAPPRLYARSREYAYPANGVQLPFSPQALLWPGTNGEQRIAPMESGSAVPEAPNARNVLYKVLLSQDPAFRQVHLETGEQRLALHPLHQPLKQGHWFWKYGYKRKGGNGWNWSPVFDFYVNKEVPAALVSPAVGEVVQRNQGPHPRLWNMHAIGDRFYQNNLTNPEARQLVAFAGQLLQQPLPVEKPMRVIDTAGRTKLEKAQIMERMYHGFGDHVGTPVRNLCIAYQLTRDDRFLYAARARALDLARMDPGGLATRDDFNSGAVLEALGWFYDVGFPVLNDAEKKLFQQAIRLRAKRIYDPLPNRFELLTCDNHVWQITLRNLAIGAVAVMKEVPEAEEWFRYIYEVWSARFPILGNTDGGWREGNGYFKVHFRSIIYLSQLLGDFSGVDYFRLPWMQNLPYYMIYTFPAGGTSTATGDMWEDLGEMAKVQAWFAEALSYKMSNPYLNWYVATLRQKFPAYFMGTDDFLFFRLLNYDATRRFPVKAPDGLPRTRLFADVGVAAMLQAPAGAGKGLCTYLLANPFGSAGHAHASQNAFTCNYDGITVLGASGFYSNFSDRHNLLHYRSSRAYSTILADSLGQKLGDEGYGWIARSLSGHRIQYALGDASQAYGPIQSEFWLDRFQQIDLAPGNSSGYGASGVKLYRRHLLQLEGDYLILYDELEADQAIKWTTQFHSPRFIIRPSASDDAACQNFRVETPWGGTAVHTYGHSPLVLQVHNKFAEPAVNWKGKTGEGGGKVKEFYAQWHAGITSVPSKKYRFLTIINVKEGGQEVRKRVPEADGLIQLEIGGWQIRAQLDGTKPAAFQAGNGQSLFNYGALPVTMQGRSFRHEVPGSSLLIEKVKGVLERKEVTDTLPAVAKYDFKKE
ncbi:DUF4962 domain-containing protein [Paraflavisolibacter sp. H34]|uniref:DUF4962 domain-containing protein n=1 Tax=Huijunlia imazamoxiresistens TaxID=3127457 RepID=UPI00301B6961